MYKTCEVPTEKESMQKQHSPFNTELHQRESIHLRKEVSTLDWLVSPGARFLKVPNLFGRISGDIILFVSSKRRRLEARNFVVILISIPFTTYEKTNFTE